MARIVLCLDNDGPGRAASAAIQKKLSEYEVIDNPPRSRKDYNDQLQMVKGISGRVRTRGGRSMCEDRPPWGNRKLPPAPLGAGVPLRSIGEE